MICWGDMLYVLVCIYNIILCDLVVWNGLFELYMIYFG